MEKGGKGRGGEGRGGLAPPSPGALLACQASGNGLFTIDLFSVRSSLSPLCPILHGSWRRCCSLHRGRMIHVSGRVVPHQRICIRSLWVPLDFHQTSFAPTSCCPLISCSSHPFPFSPVAVIAASSLQAAARAALLAPPRTKVEASMDNLRLGVLRILKVRARHWALGTGHWVLGNGH